MVVPTFAPDWFRVTMEACDLVELSTQMRL